MDRKTAINTVEELRIQMHQDIDLKCDSIIEKIKNGESLNESDNCIERTMPLNLLSAFFKGKKITAVTFSDGKEIPVSKWKEAVQIILPNLIDTAERIVLIFVEINLELFIFRCIVIYINTVNAIIINYL